MSCLCFYFGGRNDCFPYNMPCFIFGGTILCPVDKMSFQTLVFSNADAKPRNEKVFCSAGSIACIMQWYGGFFAGDRYTVTVNGRNVCIDGNGDPNEKGTKMILELAREEKSWNNLIKTTT